MCFCGVETPLVSAFWSLVIHSCRIGLKSGPHETLETHVTSHVDKDGSSLENVRIRQQAIERGSAVARIALSQN